jgi:sugar/nucleoside kinase (ribokinase family)
MSLLVVGSIAFDTVETPCGRAERVLGGSASYFSFAASFFTPVRLVGVVGTDFPREWLELFRARRIDLEGLETREGKTFFWAGRYRGSMDERETTAVELNVFGNYRPRLPDSYRDSTYVFLANGSPGMQKQVLEQLSSPRLVVCDTMNHWIRDEKQALLVLLERVDGLIINDEEAMMLTGKNDPASAARDVLGLGPEFCIIKRGSQGSFLASGEESFSLPACADLGVVDPTGAGDSFAGGVMGYLARADRVDFETLKTSMAVGTAAASFAIEDFSLEGLRRAAYPDIEARYRALRRRAPF